LPQNNAFSKILHDPACGPLIQFSFDSPWDQVYHQVPQAAGRSTCGKKTLIVHASSKCRFYCI
jgi:hypothetical protein